jgi:hypothetical protein
MSERVLVGPLLDFGRSLWNSPLLQDEFPGLESRGIKPIGKFGIGFFSIFMLGENIKVTSRPYTGGVEDTRTLEFISLNSRPILRNSAEGELPTDFTTRVSVRIADLKAIEELRDRNLSPYAPRQSAPRTIHQILSESVRGLISAVDVRIEIEDKIAHTSFTHESDWITGSAETFLLETLSSTQEHYKERIVKAHQHLLRTVESPSGECLGRAGLWMFLEDSPEETYARIHYSGSNVSVGGFLYPGRSNFKYVGVLAGETEDVRRGIAAQQVPPEYVAAWATGQARLIDPSKFSIYELITACHAIINLGGNPHNLPFCFCGGRFISLPEFDALAHSKSSIHVPVTATFSENLHFARIADLGTMIFAHTPIPEFVAIHIGRGGDLFEQEKAKSIIEDSGAELTLDDFGEDTLEIEGEILVQRLQNIWSAKPNMRLEKMDIIADKLYQMPSPRWVLSFLRP